MSDGRNGFSLGVALLIAASPALCPGQQRQTQDRLWAGLALGPSSYDLSGTGTEFVANASIYWEPKRGVLIMPSVPFFRYHAQFERPTTYLFPELSIATSPFPGPIRPYLGFGAGWGVFLSGVGESDPTIHVVSGLRVTVKRGFALRCEIKVRAVDPSVGTTSDLTCGADITLLFRQ